MHQLMFFFSTIHATLTAERTVGCDQDFPKGVITSAYMMLWGGRELVRRCAPVHEDEDVTHLPLRFL